MLGLDSRYMALALALAERGLGNVWPNPAVGCVLVRDGRVVGRGWTQRGGRPHAESEAIGRAGEAARGSTAYVTLEPCAHHGRTPPCIDLMLAAGIVRAVVAAIDPDPRVNGRGIALLRAAGMAVEVGCLEAEARRLNAGFFTRICKRRPFVALKLATSAQRPMATATSDSPWTTVPAARAEGHRLRLRHDAILASGRTTLADDPMFTCGLPGIDNRSPVRVVLDRRPHLLVASPLVRSADQLPLWLFSTTSSTVAKEALTAAGAVLHLLPAADEANQLAALLAILAEQGITRLLVEDQASVATTFLCAGMVDRIHLLDAPMLIAADRAPAAASFGMRHLTDARCWHQVEARPLEKDQLLVLEPA